MRLALVCCLGLSSTSLNPFFQTIFPCADHLSMLQKKNAELFYRGRIRCLPRTEEFFSKTFNDSAKSNNETEHSKCLGAKNAGNGHASAHFGHDSTATSVFPSDLSHTQIYARTSHIFYASAHQSARAPPSNGRAKYCERVLSTRRGSLLRSGVLLLTGKVEKLLVIKPVAIYTVTVEEALIPGVGFCQGMAC